VKNYNVVGKKWPERVLKWPNSKVVSFESNRSIRPVCFFCHFSYERLPPHAGVS
jgi:hypothetical protein